jgi:hypothetical protein
MSKSRTCFVHVPKSGGSSVIASIRSMLGAASLFQANESRYEQGPLQILLNRYPIVAGHFTFAQISDALLAKTFFFTFLRDPVDRVLSQYYYYRSKRDAAYYDSRVAHAQALDLEPFIDSLSDRPSPWSNWQTFVFSGAIDAEQPAEALLPAAMRNLERLDFVGVHDDFEEGFRHLCLRRRWPVPDVLPRANVTGDRLHVHDVRIASLERLRELNACDSQLFAHARQIWHQTKGRTSTAMAHTSTTSTGQSSAHLRKEHGTRQVVFSHIAIRTEPQRPAGLVYPNDRVFIDMCGHSSIAADDVTVGIRITDELGVEVYGTNTHLLGAPIEVREGETFEVTVDFDMRLAPGRYHVTTAIHAADDHLDGCYHWIDNAVALDCRRGTGPKFTGLVNLGANATCATSFASSRKPDA